MIGSPLSRAITTDPVLVGAGVGLTRVGGTGSGRIAIWGGLAFGCATGPGAARPAAGVHGQVTADVGAHQSAERRDHRRRRGDSRVRRRGLRGPSRVNRAARAPALRSQARSVAAAAAVTRFTPRGPDGTGGGLASNPPLPNANRGPSVKCAVAPCTRMPAWVTIPMRQWSSHGDILP